MNHPLDNPVYEALQSESQSFNIGNRDMAYFDERICPFLGMPNWNKDSQQKYLAQLPKGRSWSVMQKEPVQFIPGVEITFTTTLFQMCCEQRIESVTDTVNIRPLTDKDIPSMLALTALTKPGPFYERTILFGNYYGIFENEQLVAMGGERLHLDGYTEISAVCTDPDHLGKGYGKAIMQHLTNNIINSGRTAFLHVRDSNDRAFGLYSRLGFTKRSNIYFAIFRLI